MKTRSIVSATLAAMTVAAALLLPSVLPAGDRLMSMRVVYPNPFTEGTTFTLTMPQAGNIRISVYDLVGQQMKTLHEGFHPAGEHPIYWDGKDINGDPVVPGVYVCSLFSDETFVKSVKVIKIRK